MKKILILIGFLYSLNSFSQSTVPLRGDTIRVYKQGGDAVLKVEGHLMLKDYRQGNSNDSVLTWDPVSKKVRMMDRNSFGGGSAGLQEVTDINNLTTNSITITHLLTVNGDNNAAAAKLNTDNFGGTDAGGVLELKTLFSNFWGVISPINSFSATHYFKLAENGNGSGTDTVATLADVRAGAIDAGGVSTGYGIVNTGTYLNAALEADTSSTNHLVTLYDLTTAIAGSSGSLRFGKSGEDVRFGEDRTPSGIGTYGLMIDSLSNYWVGFKTSSSKTLTFFDYETSKTRFEIDNLKSGMYSPNQATNFRVYDDTALLALQSTASKLLITNIASGVGTKAIRYDPSTGRITYADTTTSGGSGTINSGTTGKPAYYVGSTTLDDFAAVDYATSGTNVKITTQNTTDVGLEIKGISSQSANLLNISSSSGTGDLATIAADGKMFLSNQLGIGAASVAPLSINAAFSPSYGQFSIAGTGTGTSSVVYQSYYDGAGTRLMVMGLGHYGGSSDPLYYFANEQSGGGVVFRNGAGNTFEVLNTGAAKLDYYGSGTFTGTATKWLAVDASGNIIEQAPPSGGITIGTTTITSGTNTRILYDNSGTLGEYTITGTGTVVAMAASPVFTTTVIASQGATTYKLGGSLTVNTTDVGNVGVGEDDLMTYSVPAALLAGNGDYIEFTMSFKLAANANTKQVKVKFGGTTIYASGAQAQNDGVIEITGKIIRTGAATQRITYSVTSSGTLFTDYADYVTAAETLSGAVTLKATGEATSNDDISEKILTVKFFPNN